MLVTGPRQIGKTTFLRYLAGKERNYVTLDDPMICSLAQQDPARSSLLPHIKMAVDRDRTAGQFWLTGSQQFHLMQGVSESLAGRVGVVNLHGFSQRELLNDAASAPFIALSEVIAQRDRSPTILLPALF